MQAPVDTSNLIRRYVDVQKRPTVVRLNELEAAADWIISSFYITRDIQEHLQGLRHALQQPAGCGIFVIGQYGCGKSHWLAYVTCQLRAGALNSNPPEVFPLSLLNFRATTPLEDVVCNALGIQRGGGDRRITWGSFQSQKPHGFLLVLDELSEFLRSKPDQRAFNEDVRFLQYLGEWAQQEKFWVVAAMQEGIEHTGELEHGLYRKIKDRFPLRFLLSPAHVKDLIRESILVKHEGYRAAVDALAVELQQSLPSSAIDYGDLRGLYPLHPATLQLLEEVRDRFSQARGVVDFTITQLGGDPARGVQPFLDQPWGSLLTPEAIIDHFRDLFELQPEFIGLAQQFFPYYRSQLPELFPKAASRELAERVLKLLVLVFLSPRREGLDVREAANWLVFRPSRVDPRKNVEILSRVLRQLADRGRYVVERQGQFCLELRDDSLAALESFLEREKKELQAQGETVLEQLVEELAEQDFNPLSLPRGEWQRRTVRWHFHDRSYSVYVGSDCPPPVDGVALCIRLPWGTADAAAGAYTLRPAPLVLGDELLELAALLRGRARPWTRDVKQRLEARLKERLALFEAQLRASYQNAELLGPNGEPETSPRVDSISTTRLWLDQYAEWAVRRRYPAFEQFAPGHGPLPKEAYRCLMRFAAQGELGEYDADEYVKLIREAYLVPMRLLSRQGRGYVIPANLERNELVSLIRPLLELQSNPALVYEHTAQSVYGLVPDQTGLMLVFLHILGELDILKGRRSYRELFETLPDPLQYEQLVSCSALSLDQLRDLQILCEGLHLRLPKEWTVLAQRRTVRQLKETLGKQIEPLRELLLKIQSAEEAEEAALALRELLSWGQTLRQGNDELSDMQQFLFEIGSPRRFLASLAELRELPAKLDRVLNERKRFQHLFHHPALASCLEPSLAVRVESLQTSPSLNQLDLMDRWLQECQAVYEQCKESYRRRHEAWWQRVATEPIWSWEPPRLASSRHLGLEDMLEELRSCRLRAERLRCTGLVNLDFQPLCTCGFDGRTSPIDVELNRLKSLRDQVEESVTVFFQQEPVRARLRQWIEQGLETNQETLAYLQGTRPYPQVENIQLLDQHLAGVEVVKEADLVPVVELLCERTWEKESLSQAFADWLKQVPGVQLRFRRGNPADLSEITEWSVQQALRFGIPLPQDLRGRAVADMADRIRPEWVSPEALSRLETIGLGEKNVERIIRWLLERQIPLPSSPTGRVAVAGQGTSRLGDLVFRDPPSLLDAAAEVVRPTQPTNARELAALGEQLYRVHETMVRIAGSRWLDRLDTLARTPLHGIVSLAEALSVKNGQQYILIDCLGLPLMSLFQQQCSAMYPDWQLVESNFAEVERESTTDACYRHLIAAGFRQKLEKINRVDALVHGPFLPFDDFARLAMAELAITCRNVRSRLDPVLSLTVFADHGFRIAADGRSYCHGGDSTLERVVPVFHLEPR